MTQHYKNDSAEPGFIVLTHNHKSKFNVFSLINQWLIKFNIGSYSIETNFERETPIPKNENALN